MFMYTDEERKRRLQEQKENSYDKANQIIKNTENNYRNKLLLDEQRVLLRKIYLPAICFSIFVGILGCGIFSVGICVVIGLFLKKFLWIGFIFLCLSLVILLSVYPIYKKILFHQKLKYQSSLQKEESLEEEN